MLKLLSVNGAESECIVTRFRLPLILMLLIAPVLACVMPAVPLGIPMCTQLMTDYNHPERVMHCVYVYYDYCNVAEEVDRMTDLGVSTMSKEWEAHQARMTACAQDFAAWVQSNYGALPPAGGYPESPPTYPELPPNPNPVQATAMPQVNIRPGFTCDALRLTAPLDGLPNGTAMFYWDPVPGATAYHINLYDGGAWLTGFSTDAGQTSTSADVSQSAIGGAYALTVELQAFGPNGETCSQSVNIMRAAPVDGSSGGHDDSRSDDSGTPEVPHCQQIPTPYDCIR